MTPRSQIHYLPAQAGLDEAALHYKHRGHTKIPVYEGSRDSVVGIFYVRDLLAPAAAEGRGETEPGQVSGLMREAYFVPETKSVADLFYTFRKRKLSLAVTVDEYGGVTGLVTMEDLLECIFGDILSRSELLEQSAMPVEPLGAGGYRIDAAMPLHQFNRMTGAGLESHQAESLGGLLLNAFGELPREGESIVVGGFVFEVVSVARQRISKLEVKPASALTSPEGEAAASPRPGLEKAGPKPEGDQSFRAPTGD